MNKDEALKLALEALEFYYDMHEEEADAKAITAIKKALAQDALDRKAENARELGLDYEPEPVVWEKVNMREHAEGNLGIGTSPVPQRTWVGLTDEELFKLWVSVPAETEDRFAFARAIESKLKEKNT